MNAPTILLVDNGSSRPDSTLNLRRLAQDLSRVSGRSIHPVSLQHAHKVAAAKLGGQPADTFVPFLRHRLAMGERQFQVLPLFFGRSRALTSFIPEQAQRLQAEFGPFELEVLPELSPLPQGEPRLAGILHDQAQTAARTSGLPLAQVILVDHGSPIPEVTRVRQLLAQELQARFGEGTTIHEAVMERRKGTEYDFNGPLLETALRQQAAEQPTGAVVLALLFLNPGRHAGPGGDIETICDGVRAEYPEFRIAASPLVGEHPGLVEILASRLENRQV